MATKLTDWLDGIGVAIYARLDERYGGRDAALERRLYHLAEGNGSHKVSINIPLTAWANSRAEWAWQHALQFGSVRAGDMRVRYPGLSPETLRKDLVGLARDGHLEPRGEGKGRYYVLLVPGTERQDVRAQRGAEGVAGG